MTMGIENTEIHKYVSGKWKKLSAEGDSIKLKKENDIGNLAKKSLPELEDLLQRQENILKNKKFISNLPDKGKKLQMRSDEIRSMLEELKLREQLSNNEKNKKIEDIQILEWPKIDTNGTDIETIPGSHNVDCDGYEVEDLNPLQLMANHSRDTPVALSNRLLEDSDPLATINEEFDKLNIAGCQESSIIAEDSNNSMHFSEESSYEKKIVKSVKKIEEVHKTKRKPFKPFQTLISPTVPRQTADHKSSLWVESAATGPLKQLTLKPAQTISLGNSIQLLNENKNLSKEKEYWKTVEGLSKASKNFSIGLPEGPQLNYRDTNTTIHLLDNDFDSDEEDLYSYP